MKEVDITRLILKDLRSMGVFCWKNWGGPMSKRGVADILGVLPDGHSLAIEVKTPTGTLSEYQKKFLFDFTRAGGLAFVARSVADVRAELKKVGVEPAQREMFQ